MLSGGEAKANFCQFAGGLVTGCTQGTPYVDWHITNKDATPPFLFPTDKEIKFIAGPTSGVGNIEWKWIDISGNGDWRIPPDLHSVDQWQVDVDFNPGLVAADGLSSLEYDIRITEPGYFFEDVMLTSAITPAGGGDVYKYIWTSKGGTLLSVLHNSGTYTPTPNKYNFFYINDTAQAGPTGMIDNYQNTFRQTPGPLPILGAGAAFGFSRKLRGRIKASRSA